MYLGPLGNQAQRPVTHSLSTVAVFAAAAAASRRHRIVLAGVATVLVLHFAPDIAEGYPGMQIFWPLQDTSWMVSYRWFLGMIVVLTVARVVLVRVGLRTHASPSFPSCRWRGRGRQPDLVLPGQVKNALRIVWVDGEDGGCALSAASGSGEGSQNSGPQYSSSGGAYPKNTFIPRRRSSRNTASRSSTRSGTRSNGSGSPSRAARASASSSRSRSTPAIRSSRSRPRSRRLPSVRFR